MKEREYDVIVVGTGAAGTTVAKEMTQKGKKVLMLEKGGRTEKMGSTLTSLAMVDIPTLIRNYREIVVFVNNYGGASNITAGCALPPSRKVFDPVGIDLSKEAAEAKKEMWIQPQPDEIIGENNLRLLEAANSLGYKWRRLEKFIDPGKCTGLANCMLGCKNGAKWTGRIFGDMAVAGGADLMLKTPAKNVIVEGGKAVGVETRSGRRFYAKKVVLSSGGMNNVHMLRRAGITDAGRGLCCDWLSFVNAVIPGTNSLKAAPMTVGTTEHYDDDGIIIVPVMPNWALFLGITGLWGPSHLLKFQDFHKYTSIMVKVRDDTVGEIGNGRKFNKPFTDNDRIKIDKGVNIITRIFKKAGAIESSIYAMPYCGAHPSATCRIGEVVDDNLETRIKNLYCCDASVVPSALGLPVVWTVVSLGKRLAKHLDRQLT